MFGSRPLGHRFFFGHGMLSDDTEQTCMVWQSLLAAPDDPREFARSLAWRLRWWLLGLPAGAGFGTLRALIKLWVGISPDRSGVWSAGNGPAMRVAIIGTCLPADTERLVRFVHASTRLTHTDPREPATEHPNREHVEYSSGATEQSEGGLHERSRDASGHRLRLDRFGLSVHVGRQARETEWSVA